MRRRLEVNDLVFREQPRHLRRCGGHDQAAVARELYQAVGRVERDLVVVAVIDPDPGVAQRAYEGRAAQEGSALLSEQPQPDFARHGAQDLQQCRASGIGAGGVEHVVLRGRVGEGAGGFHRGVADVRQIIEGRQAEPRLAV